MAEIQISRKVCNGVAGAQGDDGVDGNDGYSTLMITETLAVGSICVAGGQQNSFGRDFDRNGVLNSNEIEVTHRLCHGEKGETGAPGEPAENALSAAVAYDVTCTGCVAAGELATDVVESLTDDGKLAVVAKSGSYLDLNLSLIHI